MDPARGDVDAFRRNFRDSDLALPRRLVVTAANLLRRVWTPPHDCCGHDGEPGC